MQVQARKPGSWQQTADIETYSHRGHTVTVSAFIKEIALAKCHGIGQPQSR
jgi:hypothetical protein